jgi:Uma2 family endonuclease
MLSPWRNVKLIGIYQFNPMIASPNHSFLTPEEYLSYEEDSLVKHEYIDGEVYAIAGTTDTHNIIALNLATLIRSHLRGTDCRIFFADIKARIEAKNCFYYPDLLVTCNPEDLETSTYKSFPKLIIEVLSSGTEAFDRGDKFSDYQTLTSLEEYILVNSKHQRIEIFRRQENNIWKFETYSLAQPQIVIHSINLELTINDVYEDTALLA